MGQKTKSSPPAILFDSSSKKHYLVLPSTSRKILETFHFTRYSPRQKNHTTQDPNRCRIGNAAEPLPFCKERQTLWASSEGLLPYWSKRIWSPLRKKFWPTTFMTWCPHMRRNPPFLPSAHQSNKRHSILYSQGKHLGRKKLSGLLTHYFPRTGLLKQCCAQFAWEKMRCWILQI